MPIIDLSDAAANTVLDALAPLLDGGSILIYSADGNALAALRLPTPAAMDAVGRELEFNKIAEEDAATTQGTATSARIVGADGIEVFSCDVGDENSDAVIKLNTTRISRGSPVRLKSFRVVMP